VVAPAAHAAVNVNRESDENPMREVAKSILWGAIGGLMVGGAIALATDDTSKDDDYIRYGVVTGTFVGLGMGLWFVSRRPSGAAMLQIEDGGLHAHFVAPQPAPGGEVRLALVGARF
jgi:hypothetical protein